MRLRAGRVKTYSGRPCHVTTHGHLILGQEAVAVCFAGAIAARSSTVAPLARMAMAPRGTRDRVKAEDPESLGGSGGTQGPIVDDDVEILACIGGTDGPPLAGGHRIKEEHGSDGDGSVAGAGGDDEESMFLDAFPEGDDEHPQEPGVRGVASASGIDRSVDGAAKSVAGESMASDQAAAADEDSFVTGPSEVVCAPRLGVGKSKCHYVRCPLTPSMA